MDWRRNNRNQGMQVVGYAVGDGGALVPIGAPVGPASSAPFFGIPAGAFGAGATVQPLQAPQLASGAANVPQWMAGRQAPGVWQNDEDLVPLPLIAETNGGVFIAGGPTTINFVGRTQKPFRSERPVADIVPTGTSVAGVRAYAQAWVGTDYQGANIAPFNLGTFVATAFGVRLKLKPAEPGVEITFQVTLSVYPTGTDNVSVGIDLLGAYYQ